MNATPRWISSIAILPPSDAGTCRGVIPNCSCASLAARLNRVLKDCDFQVLYYSPAALSFSREASFRARHFSEGYRRQTRTLTFPEGVGIVGLAARARTSVILHSVPRWGSDPYIRLFEKHLRVPEKVWKLFDPTRRAFFCVPVFRIVRVRAGADLKVVGVLAINTRSPNGVLRSEVARAIREYAAVVQDVIEPVHGENVREIIAGGAAPLETILINGVSPRIPPIETRRTFAPGPGDEPG